MGALIEANFQRTPASLTDDFTTRTRQILSVMPGILSTTETHDRSVQLYREALQATGPGAALARLQYHARFNLMGVPDAVTALVESYDGDTGYLQTGLDAIMRAPPSWQRREGVGRLQTELDAAQQKSI